MLFNSYLFIFLFLPVTVVGFYLLRRYSSHYSIYWLILASLVFYGYWYPVYLLLLVLSVVVNYSLSLRLRATQSQLLLGLGIAANLLCIAYFKYALFFFSIIMGEDNVPELVSSIILPLAISFFTFQQIAYLVDVRNGKVFPENFSNYLLYVSLFPQLIAGPIVRFQEVVPQFSFPIRRGAIFSKLVIVGCILFSIGLFKKVVWADAFAVYANDVFALAGKKHIVGFFDAWIGAYAYTFQLYFDFSGYSDMAIGIGLMLGLKFPVNFYSPYKALNIIDFWQRWHITLSRFFRDYLYIPLGGNRKGRPRQFFNILVVMLLTGLWHGAGWTFVLWGGYHGVLVVITHLSRAKLAFFTNYLLDKVANRTCRKGISFMLNTLIWVITFHLIVLGWVLFRAENLQDAVALFNGLFLQTGNYMRAFVDTSLYFVVFMLILFAIFVVVFLPNSMQMMERLVRWEQYSKKIPQDFSPWRWRFSSAHALIFGCILYLSLTTLSRVKSDFLYFNF